jgi:hypothetical protein
MTIPGVEPDKTGVLERKPLTFNGAARILRALSGAGDRDYPAPRRRILVSWPQNDLRFAVALVVVTLSAPAAWACSCAAGWTPERAFAAADVVFLGTATPPEPSGLWIAPYERLRATTFEVEAMFKDSYAWREGTPIQISLADREDSCATSFEPGGRYLVYAWRTEGQLPQTSYCAGTRSWPTPLTP